MSSRRRGNGGSPGTPPPRQIGGLLRSGSDRGGSSTRLTEMLEVSGDNVLIETGEGEAKAEAARDNLEEFVTTLETKAASKKAPKLTRKNSLNRLDYDFVPTEDFLREAGRIAAKLADHSVLEDADGAAVNVSHMKTRGWTSKSTAHIKSLKKRAWTASAVRLFVGLLVGVLMGTVGYFALWLSHVMLFWKFDMVQTLEGKSQLFWAFIVYLAFNFVCVAVTATYAAIRTPWVKGSGVPLCVAYLDGNAVPKFLSFETLCVKVFGLILTIAASFPVGVEGPFIHIGSIIAAQVEHNKFVRWFTGLFSTSSLDNLGDERVFLVSGAAAGISSAFNAPIAGVLFARDQQTSFWSKTVTVRVFVCSVAAALTFAFALSAASSTITHKTVIDWESGSKLSFQLWEIFVFAFVGVIGGLLGALFSVVNTKLEALRHHHLVGSSKRRIAEALIFSVFVSVVLFFSPLILNCEPMTTNNCLREDVKFCSQAHCEDGMMTQLGSLVFSTPENTIKVFFTHDTEDYQELDLDKAPLAIYGVMYFILAVLAYGVALPGGLFVPAIEVGACYGRIIGRLLAVDIGLNTMSPGIYAVVGAASLMGGLTRMTVPIVIMLVELLNDSTAVVPIAVAVLVSKAVGDAIAKSLYSAHLELEKVPILPDEVPAQMFGQATVDIMTPNVQCISMKPTVGEVSLCLHSSHNTWPVLWSDGAEHERAGKYAGLISRKYLVLALEKAPRKAKNLLAAMRHARKHEEGGEASLSRPKQLWKVLRDVVTGNNSEYIDLHPYVDMGQLVVLPLTPAYRTYRAFKSETRRSLVVVDVDGYVVGIVTRKDLLGTQYLVGSSSESNESNESKISHDSGGGRGAREATTASAEAWQRSMASSQGAKWRRQRAESRSRRASLVAQWDSAARPAPLSTAVGGGGSESSGDSGTSVSSSLADSCSSGGGART